MIIYTLWHAGDDDEVPWIAGAVDEYTVDNNCEFPPGYLKKREDVLVRELILDVPEEAVRALFRSPTIKAAVVKEEKQDPVILQLAHDKLHDKLQMIRSELADLKKSYTESSSLRCQLLNDQCDLLEDILGIPRSHPRASWEDR